MVFESPLTVAEHRRWLRRNMEYLFSFFTERFAGFAIGPVFYVIHHASFEWDRRIRNPKNAALGFMRSTEHGCRLHFITFRGGLCPSQFLLLLLVLSCYYWFQAVQGSFFSLSILLPMVLGIALLSACISAFIESCTERSEESRCALLQLLSGP